MQAECVECAATITLKPGTVRGEIVVCPDCGVELEVLEIDPPKLAMAPEEEEDWGE